MLFGLLYLCTFFITLSYAFVSNWKELNLHPNHVPYVLNHHPEIAKSCLADDQCPYQDLNLTDKCWGYEKDCRRKASFSRDDEPRACAASHHKRDFWLRADFGFIADVVKEAENNKICEGRDESYSYLTCSSNARYCKAGNLYIDLRKHKPDNDRYKKDMFQKGMIGGYCDFDPVMLKEQGDHPYPLQSWYSELQNYTSLDEQISKDNPNCDIFFDKPTIFMKLDSGINIYHHFCDFFNLYLTQHVNNSWFGKDVQIVMWDTSSLGYFDIVSDAWTAFTDHPVKNLEDLAGKRVCFKEAIFSLLPRMRDGLFYNSYIPKGCVGSSMFRAFSEHFLHRMGVKQQRRGLSSSKAGKIRVTLLQRGSPENERVFRQIKNQNELVKVAEEFEMFDVKVVEYNWRTMPFVEQLNVTHNSDIFIGMHGAGLLHFLFLPDWAVAFELYNCDDPGCYYDLARLRGIHYVTWGDGKVEAFDKGKHKRYGSNPKFWNWSFDPNAFRKLLEKAKKILSANEITPPTAERDESFHQEL